MKNISTKHNKILWIDLLCFSSAVKAVGLNLKRPIDQVYYVNIHRLFKPFIGLLARFIGKPVVQVLDIVESESRIADMSLYETIQRRLTDLLDGWSWQDDIASKITAYCQKNGFDQAKFREYLKEAAYSMLYRPIEMQVLAEKTSGLAQASFIFRSTPFKELLRRAFGGQKVRFYSAMFLNPALVQQRSDYYYDKYINGTYYGSKLRTGLKLSLFWLATSINSLVFGQTAASGEAHKANIGIELIQGRVRMDDINDLYWLKSSGIDSAAVYGIIFPDYEKESKQVLAETGIRTVRLVQKLIKNPLFKQKSSDLVMPDKGYFSRTFKQALSLLQLPFVSSASAWILLQGARYSIRANYWRSIYQVMNIRLLWTMYDVDSDKLIKAQALELVDGLYAGSHWSNFPMYRVDNQKCYDALFTWGEHFIKNNFLKYPYMTVFKTGYPSDHYFNARRERSLELRNEYKNKYIVSFQDNIIANDLPYSNGMQIRIHKMLLDLLAKNKGMMVFLKPKRKYIFEQILNQFPELQKMITAGRVRIFLGETVRSKAVPAEIGMASDLVIGLGISTTAAECCFAGTVSFHADLTGFDNNKFGNAGLNKVVFRDIDSLKTAVQAQIDGRGMTIEECRKYHAMLDPFQDGQAYKRTGFIIKKLQEAFGQGLSREEAVKQARKAYNTALAQKEEVLG